jgi:hypothetical protein
MTVSELIENLAEVPSDARVVVAGYESGFNDIQELKKVVIKLDQKDEWYYGAHEESEIGIDAIALLGQNHNSEEYKLSKTS